MEHFFFYLHSFFYLHNLKKSQLFPLLFLFIAERYLCMCKESTVFVSLAKRVPIWIFTVIGVPAYHVYHKQKISFFISRLLWTDLSISSNQQIKHKLYRYLYSERTTMLNCIILKINIYSILQRRFIPVYGMENSYILEFFCLFIQCKVLSFSFYQQDLKHISSIFVT